MSMEGGMFNSRPARALKADMTVMLERTRDELPAIQELWPRFERLVGLRGRRMYAMVTAETYSACTPVKDGDDAGCLGLSTAILPGGWYLQARITGDPPRLYERIGPAMQALGGLSRCIASASRIPRAGRSAWTAAGSRCSLWPRDPARDG